MSFAKLHRVHYRLLSVPVTILAAAIAHFSEMPNPMMILIIPVVFFCYSDGYIGGGLSALAVAAYALFIYSNQGHLFSYSEINFQKALVIITGLAVLVALTGRLKAHDLRLGQKQREHLRAMSRINAELKQTAGEAQTANKAKSLFISSVSHDIRTPINIILGLTSLAMDEINNQAALKDYLEKIHSSGQHLLDLINNVLDISKMYQAFTREQTPDAVKAGGTGLGLRIVKNLADIFNGSITVDSREGQGTTFTVRLELTIVKDKAASGEKPDLGDISLEGLNILLAEDNPLNSKITSRLLMKKGVVVTCAENGCLALEAFQSSPKGFFDAVLMDIQMPEMDGLEAASLIRSLGRPDAREVPIIAMTANAFGEDVAKSMECGMNRHLTKPTTPANLYAALASLVK